MWAVAGALLAAFVLLSVAGALAGPHLHVGAAIAGVAAAVALLVVALAEANGDLAWALFGIDLAASAAIGLSAWNGLRHLHHLGDHALEAAPPPPGLVGCLGEAVSALGPEGIVRVRGEQWTAVSMNGRAPARARVQVIGVDGLRLQVWNEETGTNGLPAPDWPNDGQEVSP